jgi:hypothetical protein
MKILTGWHFLLNADNWSGAPYGRSTIKEAKKRKIIMD